MENDKKKKNSTGLLLSILGVLSLVLITAGVTYAFFSYTKEGLTENVISTGTITFVYDEVTQQGNGILIENALPMDDATGKGLTGDRNVFNFKVTSNTPSSSTIPYVVTARKSADSTLADDQVKLYLTATDASAGDEISNPTVKTGGVVATYDELTNIGSSNNSIVSGIAIPAGTEEKIIYTGVVPASRNTANGNTYVNEFVLRMWLNKDEAANNVNMGDYSPYEFVLKSEYTTTPGSCSDTSITTEAACVSPATWTPAVISTDALDAEALIRDGKLITSTAYYAKSDADRALYDRIAFVSDARDNTDPTGKTGRTVITREQAAKLGNATVDANGNWSFTDLTGYQTTEQYYVLNDLMFKVTVNVYANAATVSTVPVDPQNP